MNNVEIFDNVARVRARIERAALAAGRNPADISLVAAAKKNDAAAVKAVIAAGVDAVGENRVQEMLEKRAQGAYDGAPLHFIGHLQTNKVKHVVGKVDMLQSLDSLRLARAVSLAAEVSGIRQRVLIEVNVGDEPNKTGFGLDDLHKTLEKILVIPNICVCGLMAIPPVGVFSQPDTRYFDMLYKVFVDIRPYLLDNVDNPVLSMGMSGDYEEAIMAGATMIRVGTALFGERNKCTDDKEGAV